MSNTNKKQIRVITYGTFDMLHQGHINILKKAKDAGDYLVVGVTSDDYDRSRGKLNVSQTEKKRIAAIEALGIADKVIIEDHKQQKPLDMKKYEIDKFVIGDDWVGKFDYLNEYCDVVYTPRTEGISSTELRENHLKTVRLGIVGTGRIANRFMHESIHVGFLNIRAVMSRTQSSAQNFAEQFDIQFGYTDYDRFLNSGIDAVYISSPHEHHFEQAKRALLAGKHVLCEKPICMKSSELNELIEISKEKQIVLMEALKTAYFQGFSQIKKEIDSGKIGEVQEVRASFSKLIEDRGGREWQTPYGGAFNELASYPLLLACNLLGPTKKTHFIVHDENNVDSYTTAISTHSKNKTSIVSVGIGVKTKGCAIISGSKGYIYIPDPWWLTKTYSIHGEDPSTMETRIFDLDGDGLRYELAEFMSLIRRSKKRSKKHSYKNMLAICEVIEKFNKRNI